MHYVGRRDERDGRWEPRSEPMNQDEIVKYICSATEGVFSTMLGTESTPGEPRLEGSVPGPTEGVVSLIGLAGEWAGTGSISCSAETACRLSGQFLMSEFDSVNEEVLDAIAELTNMIVGSFKTSMEEKLGPMGLSIPTVVFGRNFTTRTLSNKDWILIPFESPQGKFDIHVCLAPNGVKPPRRARGPVCTSEPHQVSS